MWDISGRTGGRPLYSRHSLTRFRRQHHQPLGNHRREWLRYACGCQGTLAAGSASLTVSLWQVFDDSTALLMEKYYRGILENEKKSVALVEARYAVFMSGSKNPFFWAPFIVIGK